MKKEKEKLLSMSDCNALNLLAAKAVKDGVEDSKIISKLNEEEKKYYDAIKETIKLMIDKKMKVTLSCPID